MNKKKIFLISAAAIVIFMAPAAAFAFEVKKGNNIYVGENETVAGNLYAAGVNVIIDGSITGDLFCAGQSVTINGEVSGDVFCAGSAIAINGRVGGSIRVAASELSINGQVERSALAAASNITLRDSGKIGWGFLGAAANFTAYGPIGRDLQFGGASLVINNEVGGNVRFYGEMKGQKKTNAPTLTLLPKAVVNGSLTYSDSIQTDIKDGAQVKGGTIKQAPKIKEFKKWGNKKQIVFWPLVIFGLVSTVVLGLVLVRLNSDAVEAVTD
ncbi:MAG: polymer-forming cytoskeletal protein, partial [Patescibacteria group bacterium]